MMIMQTKIIFNVCVSHFLQTPFLEIDFFYWKIDVLFYWKIKSSSWLVLLHKTCLSFSLSLFLSLFFPLALRKSFPSTHLIISDDACSSTGTGLERTGVVGLDQGGWWMELEDAGSFTAG